MSILIGNDEFLFTSAAALFSFLNFLERVPPFLREEIFLIDKLYSVFLREDFGTFAIHHDVSRFFHDQPRQAHWVLNVLQTRDRAGLERISVHDGRVQFVRASAREDRAFASVEMRTAF